MTKYTMDNAGFAELAASDGVGDACLQAAQAGAREARRISPRSGNKPAMADSFRAERATVLGGRKNEQRAGAVLYNTEPQSAYAAGRKVFRAVIPYIERGE